MNDVEQNKDLIRHYMEATWHGEDVEAQYGAATAETHTPSSPSGVPSMAQTAAYLRAALPDLKLDQSIIIGQEDRVMEYFSVTGAHRGAPLFDFPPSGRELTLDGETIFRIADGKIVERWSIIDAANLFQQLSADN